MGKLIKTVGEIVVDGKRVCSDCGADLGDGKNIKFICHGDGDKSYSYMFECVKCGNLITQTFERSRKERWW